MVWPGLEIFFFCPFFPPFFFFFFFADALHFCLTAFLCPPEALLSVTEAYCYVTVAQPISDDLFACLAGGGGGGGEESLSLFFLPSFLFLFPFSSSLSLPFCRSSLLFSLSLSSLFWQRKEKEERERKKERLVNLKFLLGNSNLCVCLS